MTTTTKIDSLNLPTDLVAKLRAEVLYDDATLEAATAVDVATLPIGLKIRLRTVFPNVAEHPRTEHPAGVAHLIAAATRVNPLLAGLADHSDATFVIVTKIADGNRSPDVLSAARTLSISSVARLDGAVSVPATLSYLAHLAEGGSTRESWKDHEIVPLAELIKKLRVSPTNGGELEDGVDPRTGIDWSSKPDEMVARIRFAAQDNLLTGLSDAAVVAAFEGGDQKLIERTKRRMKVAKVDVEDLLRGLRGGRHVATGFHASQAVAPTSAGSSTANLHGLLLRIFSADEMRRFVRYGVDGERLAGSLPGTNTSPAETAFSVVELWRRQGLITRSTMDGLIAERPRQAEAIRRVFEQFGVH